MIPPEYPQIFEASRSTLQPGGIHLSDPDQIDVGQTLTIPRPPVAAAPPQTRSRHRRRSTGHLPRPFRAPPIVPMLTARPAAGARCFADSFGAAQNAPATTSRTPPRPQRPPRGCLLGSPGRALLAGSMLMLLRRRRRAQFETAAPDEPQPGPDPQSRGRPSPPSARSRRHRGTHGPGPAPAGRISRPDGSPQCRCSRRSTHGHLILHLSEPASLPAPWDGSETSSTGGSRPRSRWSIGPAIPRLNPHRTLAGHDRTGLDEIWLLNVGTSTSRSPATSLMGGTFARYLAAEVACNPWSAGVDVACLGVPGERLAQPDRIHVYEPTPCQNDPVEGFSPTPSPPINRAPTQTATSAPPAATKPAPTRGPPGCCSSTPPPPPQRSSSCSGWCTHAGRPHRDLRRDRRRPTHTREPFSRHRRRPGHPARRRGWTSSRSV